MRLRSTLILSVGLTLPLLAAGPASAQSRSPVTQVSGSVAPARRQPTLPLEAMQPKVRDSIAKITQQPTIVARAEPEEFSEGIYGWLVENPDRASLAWRRLGIPCAAITPRPDGQFGWTDGQGTEVVWRTAYKSQTMHVWLAEGQAKLGPMLPTVPVRAVAILHHQRQVDSRGQANVTQQTEIYLQTDSKAAALVARILGPAIPRLADTGASQLLLFFSGLTRYLENHPEDIRSLLAPAS